MLRLKQLYTLCAFSTNLSLDRFRVADKVLHTFYHHDGRQMLTDTICKEVVEMDVDQSVKSEILSLFDPQGGIRSSQMDMSYPNYRFQLAQNKKGMFPFFPHSIIMRSLMRNLYDPHMHDKSEEIYRDYRRQPKYLLGSPGFSKTISFFILRYFHNIKVSHIIKYGRPQNSYFKNNLKIFQFVSTTEKQELITIIKQTVLNDFGDSQLQKHQQIFNKQDINQISKLVKKIYKQKNIAIKVIIDQFNQISNLNQTQKQECTQNLRSIIKNLRTQPIMFVSSKHNSFQNQSQTLNKITGKTLKRIYKINLDNEFSPQSRILYVIQSLIFQFIKRGIQRHRAIEIVRSLKYYAMITHLGCANFVNTYFGSQQIIENYKRKDLKVLINQDQVNQLNNTVQDILNIYKKNENQIKKEQIDELRARMLIINQILKLNQNQEQKNEQDIGYRLQFYDGTEPIKGSQKVFAQKITLKPKQVPKMFLPNYFFLYKSKNIHKIYSCLLPQQIKWLKFKILHFPTDEQAIKIKSFSQKWKIESEFETQRKKGMLFEDTLDFVVRYYEQKSLTLQFNLKDLKGPCIRQKEQMPIINDYKLNEEKKSQYEQISNQEIQNNKYMTQNSQQMQQKRKYDRYQTSQRNIWSDQTISQVASNITKLHYYRAQKNNLVFDYIIPIISQNIFSILLVDCTIKKSTYDNNKINKFKTKLLTNNNFTKLMTKICEVPTFKYLSINYIILKPWDNNNEHSALQQGIQIQDSFCSKLRQVQIINKKLTQVRCQRLKFLESFQILLKSKELNKQSQLESALKKYLGSLKLSKAQNNQIN